MHNQLFVAKLFFVGTLSLAKVKDANFRRTRETDNVTITNEPAHGDNYFALLKSNITDENKPIEHNDTVLLASNGLSESHNNNNPYNQSNVVNATLSTASSSQNASETEDKEEIVAYVAGDICDDQPGSVGCADTAKIIMAENSSDFIVLPLGDLVYESGTIDEFNKYYHPHWGQFKNRTFPILGNHEKKDRNIGYFKYWGTSGNRSTSPGAPDEGYYSFDVGASWHLVALNTNVWKPDQREWLKQDLAKNVRPCTLVYGHNPRYSPGKYGKYGKSGVSNKMFEVFDILVEKNVDIYLAGHDHIYARYGKQDGSGNAFANGTAHFLVGTGGKNMQPVDNIQMENLEAWYTPRQNRVSGRGPFGITRLVLGKGKYDSSYLTTDGSFTDYGGTVHCNSI